MERASSERVRANRILAARISKQKKGLCVSQEDRRVRSCCAAHEVDRALDAFLDGI